MNDRGSLIGPPPTRHRPTELARETDRLTSSIAGSLGRDLRSGRIAARLTQAELGELVGIHQTWVSDIELGRGDGVPVRLWVALGIAVGRPLAMAFSKPIDSGAMHHRIADAGHLQMQGALLAMAAATGRRATAELPTRPSDPSHSIDVAVWDEQHRTLIVQEAWNTFGRHRCRHPVDPSQGGRGSGPRRVRLRRRSSIPRGHGLDRARHGFQPRLAGAVSQPLRGDVRWIIAGMDPCPRRGLGPALTTRDRVVRPGGGTDHRVAPPMSMRCIARMGHHSAMTDTFDFGRFDALTFDCYGTLIDWETGLSAALRAILDPRGVTPGHDELLETYAGLEAEAERPPYRTYREVLAFAVRGVAATYGVEPTDVEIAAFAGSVVDWPAFADSPAALAALKVRFRLGVLTNCDDDLFAASNRRLGVEFDWVVTAQQVGGYKPATANFEMLFERVGLPRDRILHVAQSLYHDHVPAKAHGLSSIWIDRRHDRSGAGATPPANANPDRTFPDMASFAAAATSRTLTDR